MSDPDWGEVHGYTNRCAGCGQSSDMTYCSARCEIDARAMAVIEDEPGDMLDGENDTVYGRTPSEQRDREAGQKEHFEALRSNERRGS